MLIFMDEWGDDGIKLDAGSSPRFIFAAVAFPDAAVAAAGRAAIHAVRAELGHPASFEFKHLRTRRPQLFAMLGALASIPFRAVAVACEKNALQSGIGLRDGVRIAALDALEMGEARVEVISDVFGGRTEERRIRLLLRHRLRDAQGQSLLRGFRMHRARSDVLIQLADVVAGAANDVFEGDRQLENALGGKLRLKTKTPADP